MVLTFRISGIVRVNYFTYRGALKRVTSVALLVNRSVLIFGTCTMPLIVKRQLTIICFTDCVDTILMDASPAHLLHGKAVRCRIKCRLGGMIFYLMHLQWNSLLCLTDSRLDVHLRTELSRKL